MANNNQSWDELNSLLQQLQTDPNVSTEEAAHQAYSGVVNKVESDYAQISNLINGMINVVYSFKSTVIDLNRVELERRKAILNEELTYAQQVISKSMSTITSAFSKTANQLALDNTKSMQELIKGNIKMQRSIEVANVRAQLAEKQSLVGFVHTITDLATAAVDVGVTMVGNTVGEAITAAASAFDDKKAAMMTGEISSYLIGNITAMSKTAANAFATAMKAQLDYDIKRAELQLDQMQAVNDMVNQFIQTAESAIEPWTELVKTTQETWMKVDTASRKLAITMGYYGNQGESYTTHIMSIGEHMADVFGKDLTELIEAQKLYSDASERNVMLGLSGQEVMAGTERLFGISQGEVAQLYGGMNVFNTSIDSAGDMMQGMYHTITKMGLSASKFSKDLVNNLQLAQKYNFKGGVENMMKLTQWANQTRFNLQSATSFSDKLTSANLSDALETSAKLQVLGGSAAIYSDPLGMLYDAGADIGDMAHRMANMFNDLSGTFNKTTGETEFSWYENYMIKQRAAALGMDDKDVKNMIRQNNKQGIINRELRGYGLDDETKTAIGNRATYNQKAGRWEVKSLTGDTFDMKTIAEHPELLKNILPEDNEEAMLAIAQKSLSYEELQVNYQKAIAAKLGADTESINKSAAMTNLRTVQDYYSRNYGNVKGMYGQTNDYIVGMNQKYYEKMEQYFTTEGQEAMRNFFQGFLIEAAKVSWSSESVKEATKKWGTAGAEGVIEYYEGIFKESITAMDAAQKVLQQTMITATNAVETGTSIFDMVKTWATNLWGDITNSNNNGENTGISGMFSTVQNSVEVVDKKIDNISKKIDQIIPLKAGTVEPTTTEAADAIMIDQKSNNLIQPSPNDQFLFAQTGGPIDVLFKGIFGEIQSIGSYIKTNGGTRGGNSNLNIQLSGEIKLNENGKYYNLLDDLKTRDILATQIASTLQEKMSSAIANSANTSDFNWGRV